MDAAHGMAGRVPFRFACRRSGNCCRVPGGYVWLADGEVERIAARLGRDVERVLAELVRTVPDPRTGALRLALREDARGGCVFLEGANECRVYEARPEHCARFPFWPSVLTDERGFERARAVCPGIEPVAGGAVGGAP